METAVKKLALGLIAVTTLIAVAAPAMAQGFGFPLIAPYYSDSPYYGYYNYAPSPGYYAVPGYTFYDHGYWGWNGYRWNYYQDW